MIVCAPTLIPQALLAFQLTSELALKCHCAGGGEGGDYGLILLLSKPEPK